MDILPIYLLGSKGDRSLTAYCPVVQEDVSLCIFVFLIRLVYSHLINLHRRPVTNIKLSCSFFQIFK